MNTRLPSKNNRMGNLMIVLTGQNDRPSRTVWQSMLGETLGASGPIQAVALLETMRDGMLPGIPQLKEINDDFPLKMVRADSREEDVINGLINSIGFDGHCSSLILTQCDN